MKKKTRVGKDMGPPAPPHAADGSPHQHDLSGKAFGISAKAEHLCPSTSIPAGTPRGNAHTAPPEDTRECF